MGGIEMKIQLSIVFCLLLASSGNAGPPPKGGSSAATTEATTTTTAASGDTTASSTTSTFCSDVMSDDGSTVVSANTYCGDDAEGYMEVCSDGDYNYILVSGAPDHDAEYDQVITNPNERCERWQYVKVSSTWEDSGEITYDMGSVGYIYSGAVYFDARSSTDGDSAIYNEGDSLDPYYGHSEVDGVQLASCYYLDSTGELDYVGIGETED